MRSLDTASKVTLTIVLIAYGFYTISFIACAVILTLYRGAYFKLHFSAICILFVSITTAMSLFIAGDDPKHPGLRYLYNSLSLLAHGVADLILLSRCYLVWGGSRLGPKRVIALPVVLFIASIVFGMLRVIDASKFPFALGGVKPPGKGLKRILIDIIGFYSTSLATNVLLTALTAGRIVHHIRKRIMTFDEVNRSQFQRAVYMIIESGVIYSLVLTAVILVLAAGRSFPAVPIDRAMGTLVSLTLQTSGLMPTLILLRSALARRSSQKASSSGSVTGLRVRKDNNTSVTIELDTPIHKGMDDDELELGKTDRRSWIR